MTGSPCRAQVEGRAPLLVVVRPEPAPVGGDDRSADREAEAKPVRLRGHERLEDPLHLLFRNARSPDRRRTAPPDPRSFVAVRIVTRRSPRACRAHRIARVEEQVQQHLLQLHAVGEDRRKGGASRRIHRDLPLDQVAVHQLQHLGDHLVDGRGPAAGRRPSGGTRAGGRSRRPRGGRHARCPRESRAAPSGRVCRCAAVAGRRGHWRGSRSAAG